MRTCFALIALLTFSVGCTTIPETTFDAHSARIESIALAPTHHDEELLLRYRRDQFETVDIVTPVPVAKLFTLVAEDNREARFAKQTGSATDVYARRLQDGLGQILESEGFDTFVATTDIDEELARDRNGMLKKIPASAFGNAQALLESASSIGFTAAGRGKPFKPTLWLTVRLTDRRGNVRLYDQIQLNPSDGREQGMIIYPSDRFMFADQEELTAAERRAKALDYAIERVSREFTHLIRGARRDVERVSQAESKARTFDADSSWHDNALALDCSNLGARNAVALSGTQTVRQTLDPQLTCRWHERGPATPSVLFAVPASSSATEIEVATRLDAEGTTAAHVVSLDARFEPLAWVPFENFHERKGNMVARFFLEPSDETRYVLAGGAGEAAEKSLERTYEPTSTSLLNFAGLVTARERKERFRFVPEGEVRVKIRKPSSATVDIVE